MCGFLRQKRHKQFFFTAYQYAQSTIRSLAARRRRAVRSGCSLRKFAPTTNTASLSAKDSILCPNHCAPLRPSERRLSCWRKRVAKFLTPKPSANFYQIQLFNRIHRISPNADLVLVAVFGDTFNRAADIFQRGFPIHVHPLATLFDFRIFRRLS